MYLRPTKTAAVQALRDTFDVFYPESDFQNLHISIEFPMTQQDYPGIWVQFEDTEAVERAGIKHIEQIQDDQGAFHQVTRYRFGGNFSFTVAALSSNERDRIYDQLVRVLAFNDVEDSTANRFRSFIENNDLIGININYDVLNPSGDAANPGTPWETNEVIYERTLSVAMIGEFVSDPTTNELVLLSKVLVEGLDEDVDDLDSYPDIITTGGYDPTQWT